VVEYLIDTATFVDLQRAPKHRRADWARNTIQHASMRLSRGLKPGLSPLVILEIEAGFEQERRAERRALLHREVFPMFELTPFGQEEATLSGEIYARLEEKRLRIGIVDTCIAATAIVQGLTLVSANR